MRESFIKGLFIKDLEKHADHRGSLMETFRIDELAEDVRPAMSYVTFTKFGFYRGPHVHHKRVELFAFPGPGTHRIIVWDGREESPTYHQKEIIIAGEDDPKLLVIYPGLVHVVEAIDPDQESLLINHPTTLFRGWGRKEDFTDEVKYEDDDSFYWREYKALEINE